MTDSAVENGSQQERPLTSAQTTSRRIHALTWLRLSAAPDLHFSTTASYHKFGAFSGYTLIQVQVFASDTPVKAWRKLITTSQ